MNDSAGQIAAAVHAGEVSCIEVAHNHLRAITEHNDAVNAFTAVYRQRALLQAERVDQALSNGQNLPLAGVPFAVKNLFDVAEEVTLAGSLINADSPPADCDALLIRRLEQAGAVLVGSLNMGEYAYDFTGENHHYGACRNPWALDRMSGGSSSGSGAALAAGMVPLTLGTDTNGSIRVPSAFCGTWGLKPTYGRLPRTGAFPFCDSLDHVGPMARSVPDLAMAYNTLQGFSNTDHACVNRPIEPVSLTEAVSGMRVGIAKGYFDSPDFERASAGVRQAAEFLQAEGCEVVPVTLAEVEAGRAAAFIITNIEGGHLHAARLRKRAGDFDPDTRPRLLAGSLLPAAWYLQAQRVREHYRQSVLQALADVDLMLAPATPFPAPALGQKTVELGGETVGLRANIGYFTQPISCIGLPVICAPMMSAKELPMGVQLIGKPWQEQHCFTAAAALEAGGQTRSTVAAAFLN